MNTVQAVSLFQPLQRNCKLITKRVRSLLICIQSVYLNCCKIKARALPFFSRRWWRRSPESQGCSSLRWRPTLDTALGKVLKSPRRRSVCTVVQCEKYRLTIRRGRKCTCTSRLAICSKGYCTLLNGRLARYTLKGSCRQPCIGTTYIQAIKELVIELVCSPRKEFMDSVNYNHILQAYSLLAELVEEAGYVAAHSGSVWYHTQSFSKTRILYVARLLLHAASDCMQNLPTVTC